VTMDPVIVDAKFPPSMIPFVINSGGSNLNAIVYVVQGSGPHPTVLLLHGFPGNEKNHDLAQAIRRAGWNVVFFHYRGAWGSQGNFSLDHCLEDTSTALMFLRNEINAKRFRVDTGKIALVGHSMGGFMALRTIVDDPNLVGAVWIAGGNISEFGSWASKSTENKTLYERSVQESSAPLKGIDIEHFVTDVMEHLTKWDLRTHAEVLAERKLFMIGASNDEEVPLDMHYIPLIAALRRFNPQHLSTVVLDTDHSFSNKRIELAHRIISWLNQFQ
jgi:pimeloyl-ACP methyl ester carboxylesterase